MSTAELTGPRASVLRAVWWGVLLASVWLAVAWPFEAYRVVLHCDPSDVRHHDAGGGWSLVLGLVGIATAGFALVRHDLETQGVAAGLLLLALPFGCFEWLSVTSDLTHKCGADVSAAWFATPTRNAAFVLTVAGPAMFVLVRVLRWLEARSGRESLPRVHARR